ncbi:hypothetical protein MY3296_003762 [Beauveria thailandica]
MPDDKNDEDDEDDEDEEKNKDEGKKRMGEEDNGDVSESVIAPMVTPEAPRATERGEKRASTTSVTVASHN